MSESEFNILYEQLDKLKELLKVYGGKYYRIQYGVIEDMIACIKSDLSCDDKEKYVVRNYKNLYPANGGLSDFYIQHDNYEERLKLNKPLDEINETLWSIMKNHI
ncbi:MULTISPECIES: hypothetical protein [Clostridium]|uniref:hypothetical protein n=1 Tax=Clostridium TaxID=1485 RepID=UPI0006B2679B|nr:MULTISPECIES: hypothetical protein [Clostridium]KOY66628.1 hypothetical protein AN649_06550 [Clostridium sporogenes]MDU7253598.1 hypothetical protein [Clostridium sp.]